MKRRDFITLVGGAAATWPLAARAQPSEKMRRIGMLMAYAESDSVAQSYVTTFTQALQQFGWVDGRNARIDYRWGAGAVERMHALAKDLVTLQPDVILCSTTPVTVAMHRQTNAIPIVFTVVSDPVGAGLVAGLARPGGNVTGFINIEASMGANGSNYSRRLRPALDERRSCSIPTLLLAVEHIFLPRSTLLPDHCQ
jgi:putative ABC transport system substrate-binding protein